MLFFSKLLLTTFAVTLCVTTAQAQYVSTPITASGGEGSIEVEVEVTTATTWHLQVWDPTRGRRGGWVEVESSDSGFQPAQTFTIILSNDLLAGKQYRVKGSTESGTNPPYGATLTPQD